MATLSFSEARACVIEKLLSGRLTPSVDKVGFELAAGRVLAEDIRADRDYPPADRSVRDGFAVRAADVPGELRVSGEIRAGEPALAQVGPGEAVEIMTGGSMPSGADSVIMVEHVERDGDRIRTERAAERGQFINPKGCEAREGQVVLRPGKRLVSADIALLAMTGRTRICVYAKPRVAILATGDEIVEPDETPLAYQIRNSNAYSLSAQVARAGGLPMILPLARDRYDHTRQLIARGLGSADLLLLSGGVSAGKYDLVEQVLSALGAEFFFDRVLIQPGQPLVFGRALERFFFGLPGNPASTLVTFEIFARAALELLAGQQQVALPMPLARLTSDFRHRPGLTRFLPACLSADGSALTPMKWQGSGDIPALARANAFLVADAERAEWKAGELMPVLLQ